MQAVEYEEEGYDRVRLQGFWDGVERAVTTELQEFFDVLKDERPKFGHASGARG